MTYIDPTIRCLATPLVHPHQINVECPALAADDPPVVVTSLAGFHAQWKGKIPSGMLREVRTFFMRHGGHGAMITLVPAVEDDTNDIDWSDDPGFVAPDTYRDFLAGVPELGAAHGRVDDARKAQFKAERELGDIQARTLADAGHPDVEVGSHDCRRSPIGICAYEGTDSCQDFCVFCSWPSERK